MNCGHLALACQQQPATANYVCRGVEASQMRHMKQINAAAGPETTQHIAADTSQQAAVAVHQGTQQQVALSRQPQLSSDTETAVKVDGSAVQLPAYHAIKPEDLR